MFLPISLFKILLVPAVQIGARLGRPARRGLAAVVVAVSLLATGPVNATPVSYSWNTAGSYTSSSYGNEIEFSANENSSVKLKVRSYSSYNDTSDFYDAATNLYSGGIGVKNQFESGGSPNHAVDNDGHNDLVLFEFDSDDFNPTSFKLGWDYNDSDVRVWVGGSGAGLDLTSDCAGACTVGDLGGLGFTQLSDFVNAPVNSSVSLGTSLTGRYLLIAGGSEYYYDYFKIKQIGAEAPTHDAPEPASLGIFGLGLVGLVCLRRKRVA